MRKKYIVNIVFGIVLLLLAGLIFYLRLRKPEELRTVMEINGQEVAKEEYQLVIKRYQAQVKSQYSTEEANQKDFWTTEKDGGAPLAVIMSLAEEDLIQKKTAASMAKEKGIDADMDYTSIKASLEKENTSRSGKEDSGNVTYGLSSYTEGDYYQYVYTELEAQLMEVLKKEQDITREELEAAYQESRDAYSYETGVTMLIAETKSENAALLQDAVKSMEEGKSREELTEVFPDISFYELEMNTLDTQEGKSGVYSIRWILASAMREGEISQLVTAGQNSLVMKCLKREDDGVLPFDQIEGTLKSQMQTKKASSVIENEVKKAEVKEKRGRLEAAAKEILLQQQDE